MGWLSRKEGFGRCERAMVFTAHWLGRWRQNRRLRRLGELWIVAAEMQAATLAPGLRRAHDELGHLYQVAQFQQVARHVKKPVELLDFALQQRDAVLGALQPLVGAHDAYVVPHEAP